MARRARFSQRAPLRLRQEALAIQRGLDKARIAVELHQVEDLKDVGRNGEREGQVAELTPRPRDPGPAPSLGPARTSVGSAHRPFPAASGTAL